MGNVESATYLRSLLCDPSGKVRGVWAQRLTGSSSSRGFYSAVSAVIAEYLWDAGERSEQDSDLRRRLRDRVRRALTGESLTPETLRWFIEAFSLEQLQAAQLWALREGSREVRVLQGSLQEPPTLPLPPRRLRTLSLHEHHYVGPDGWPARHQTTQVLEATTDGVENYLYIFDTAMIAVDVAQGGHAGDQMWSLGDGLFGVPIQLTRPLSAGETTTLTYVSTFMYSAPPAPCFRRAAFTRVDAVDLRVEFHPGRIPQAVFFAQWPNLDDPPTVRTPRRVEPDLTVHVFKTSVENAILGFEWVW